MEEQREAIRHSNRPLAFLLVIAVVGVLGFSLVRADRGSGTAQEPPATSMTTSTTVNTTVTSSAAPTSTSASTTTSPASVVADPQARRILDLADGAGPMEQRRLPDGTSLLWWSYPDDGLGRLPGIALVDAEGLVLWENEGREGSRWQSDRTNTRGQSSRTFFVDGVAIKADVDNEANSVGTLVAFDLVDGNRLWMSQFRVPLETTSGGVTVSMHLRSGEELIVTRTVGLGLIRVSPLTGSPMWSADVPAGRVAGSFRRSDGSEVIAIATDSENLFLDVDTGDLVPLAG